MPSLQLIIISVGVFSDHQDSVSSRSACSVGEQRRFCVCESPEVRWHDAAFIASVQRSDVVALKRPATCSNSSGITNRGFHQPRRLLRVGHAVTSKIGLFVWFAVFSLLWNTTWKLFWTIWISIMLQNILTRTLHPYHTYGLRVLQVTEQQTVLSNDFLAWF